MQIYINEHKIDVVAGSTAYSVRSMHKPNADIVIYNGFPISDDVTLSENDTLVFITRGEKPKPEELDALLTARHTPFVHGKLKTATVGIAGCGGLGSTIAISLARSGIGTLILADFDVVEPSNLNRQQYFIEHIGMYKVEALQGIIARINPNVTVRTFRGMIEEKNCAEVFAGASIIVEAFDRASYKSRLVNHVLTSMPGVFIVAGNGMAGYGPNDTIVTQKIGSRLFVCGDGVSEAQPGNGLMAPRVGICANAQANQVLRIILGEDI